jgi:hypothetical protein
MVIFWGFTFEILGELITETISSSNTDINLIFWGVLSDGNMSSSGLGNIDAWGVFSNNLRRSGGHSC